MNRINFQLHPITKESEYIKNIYIALLVNMALSDGDVTPQEQEYLKSIGKTAGVSEQQLQELACMKLDSLLESFQYDFIGNKITYTLICDMMILAFLDEDINDDEMNFIGTLAEVLDLDSRIFEYLFRVAQAVASGDDNSYLIAVLSRHKDVNFSLFRFYFDDRSKKAVQEYVDQIIKSGEVLKKMQGKLKQIDFDDEEEIVDNLTDEFEYEISDEIERLEEICTEFEEATGDYLTISDEDVYWELIELMSEIEHATTMLFIHAGEKILFESGFLDSKSDAEHASLEQEGKILCDYISEVLSYLGELEKNY